MSNSSNDGIDFSRLERRIRLDEGFSSVPYKDTVGVWTIGYGATHIAGEPVTQRTTPVSQKQALYYMRSHIFAALGHVQKLFPTLDPREGVRWEALTNMAYNLGFNGLAGFVKLQRRVAEKDWLAASEEVRDSRYYRQVGNRAERIRLAIRDGRWHD